MNGWRTIKSWWKWRALFNQLDDHPAARGLQLISRGFPLVTDNDQETAQRASFVYDALYASIKSTITV